MRASKINNLLIMLDQGMFGTVRDYCVDSIGWRGLVQGGESWAVYRECTEDWQGELMRPTQRFKRLIPGL